MASETLEEKRARLGKILGAIAKKMQDGTFDTEEEIDLAPKVQLLEREALGLLTYLGRSQTAGEYEAKTTLHILAIACGMCMTSPSDSKEILQEITDATFSRRLQVGLTLVNALPLGEQLRRVMQPLHDALREAE